MNRSGIVAPRVDVRRLPDERPPVHGRCTRFERPCVRVDVPVPANPYEDPAPGEEGDDVSVPVAPSRDGERLGGVDRSVRCNDAVDPEMVACTDGDRKSSNGQLDRPTGTVLRSDRDRIGRPDRATDDDVVTAVLIGVRCELVGTQIGAECGRRTEPPKPDHEN